VAAAPPLRCATSSCRWPTAYTTSPLARLASSAFSRGTTSARPASRAANAAGSTPCTGRSARQGQFAQAFDVFERNHRHLAIGGEDPQGDGQIVAPTVLGQVGRGEVLGDAPGRVFQPGVDDGAAYPVLAFLDRGFRQTDQGKRRQAVGQVGFDTDGGCQHAHLGAAVDEGEGHGRSVFA
jgi:hypothetical protein